MSLHVVSWAEAPEQPWRNGGGRTRELLAWPTPEAWRVRVSVADIERSGPFSPFPGVHRSFQVLSGEGVRLSGTDLTPDSTPHAFDGALAPDCTLLGGPTRDLNLMVAGGRGRMWPATQSWMVRSGWRAVYTTQATTLHAGPHTLALPAHALAWSKDAPGVWLLEASAEPVRAWWLNLEDTE